MTMRTLILLLPFLILTLTFTSTSLMGGEYYGYWGRDLLLQANGWVDEAPDLERLYIDRYADAGWLARLLKQFPQADADGDGRITAEEAVLWHVKRVPLITPGADLIAWLPDGVTHWMEIVTAEDGVKLGTEVYLPPGEGPFPVLVGRGIRQGGQMDCAHWYLGKGFAVVSQDVAPLEEGVDRGMHGGRSRSRTGPRRDPGPDTKGLLEWTSRQAWCDGNIALWGYSAGGMATLPVLQYRPPELDAVVTHIACTDATAIFRSRGGVRSRRNYDPENMGGWDPGTPPLPDRQLVPTVTPDEGIKTFKTDMAGWFDIFQQGSIDDWNRWKATGRAVLVMGAGSHGPWPLPSRVPPDYSESDIFWPDVPQFNLLNGGIDFDSVKSVMLYFKMGDMTNPEAPGNQWMITDTWPLPATETAFYLAPGGKLSRQAPRGDADSVAYAYDPKDPVVRVDIKSRGLIADGPADQRPLRDRDDVIYFTTDPLSEPLEVNGQMNMILHVSSDAPDTTFMVKLLDIYPDGYEAMMGHGTLMARYHDGYDKPQPLEAGKVTRLDIDLWSTSMVFDEGHRLGVFVTSSDAGRFAVHPNTWDAIESYDEARVAHNTIHFSREHPSHLVLPVTELGAGTIYDPAVHIIAKKTKPWDK